MRRSGRARHPNPVVAVVLSVGSPRAVVKHRSNRSGIEKRGAFVAHSSCDAARAWVAPLRGSLSW